MRKLGLLVAMSALLMLLTLALPSLAPEVEAQSGGSYNLTWNTFDGGGATFSTGGTYSLGGTIGQPDAGTMSGGSYSLRGGFWVDFLGDRIMLPLIQK